MAAIDYTGLKKPDEYGDGKGTSLGRALTPQEVHQNFLWIGEELEGYQSFSMTDLLAQDGEASGIEASKALSAYQKPVATLALRNIMAGAGAPAAGTGSNGDIYIRTS